MEKGFRTLSILFIVAVVLLVGYMILQENERRRESDDNVTAPLPDVPVAANIVCDDADVNNDGKFSLTDFAGFAQVYNNNCDSRVSTATSNTPARLNVELRATDVPNGANAINFDIDITNAEIVSLTLSDDNSWLPRIGTCNVAQDKNTTNRVCFSAAKSVDLVEDELLATVLIEFDGEESAVFTRTSDNYYSEGLTRIDVSGLLATVESPLNGAESVCGNQDVNEDFAVNLIDFSSFARRYAKVSCAL